MLNPYQSSSTSQLLTASQRQRGYAGSVVAIIALTLLGYTIPFLIIGSIHVARGFPLAEYVDDVWTFHSHFDRDGLAMLDPNFGCALLFGLSAIASYGPENGDRFIRSLMKVGGTILIGVLLMVFATVTFNLGQQTYTSDPYAGFRRTIVATPPVMMTLLILYRRYSKQDESRIASKPGLPLP